MYSLQFTPGLFIANLCSRWLPVSHAESRGHSRSGSELVPVERPESAVTRSWHSSVSSPRAGGQRVAAWDSSRGAGLTPGHNRREQLLNDEQGPGHWQQEFTRREGLLPRDPHVIGCRNHYYDDVALGNVGGLFAPKFKCGYS